MDVEANIVDQAQLNSTERRRDSSLKSRLLEHDGVGKTDGFNLPSFVIPPRDSFILSNETGIIETRIFSVPKPIVRWYKNGQLITSAQFPKTKKHHYIPETYALEIPDALASDMGTYTCVARNAFGSMTSSATLRIIDLETDEYPKFLKRLKRTDITAGSNSHLEVSVSGVPKPEVEWFKNSIPLKENKRIEICHKEPNSYVLRFRDTEPEDSGVYTCRAKNSFGITSTSAMVYVEKVDNLKRVWAEDVALSSLGRRQCPDGWSQREMDDHMYRITLANYHIKHRTPITGYINLF